MSKFRNIVNSFVLKIHTKYIQNKTSFRLQKLKIEYFALEFKK